MVAQIPNRFQSIFTCSLVLATLAFADDGGVPGAIFNYGMSPRTIGMGKAFTGLANDQEAVYYNPAGLTQLYVHNIKASHLELFGHRLEYLGYAMPTREFGTLGVGLLHLFADDLPSRDVNMGVFDPYYAMQNCLIFSYAYQPARPFGLGTNLKFVMSRIAQYNAAGMGGDLGLFLFPRRNLTFGLTCQNILGPRLVHNPPADKPDEFPLTFRAGSALKLYQGRATIAIDLVKNILKATQVEHHFGIEFSPLQPLLTLRAGLDRNFINAGIGLKKEWGRMSLGIDYSIEIPLLNYLLPYRHKIGMHVDFGGFRTWIDATPKQFSPEPGRKDNVAWLNLHYSTKREIKRWQLLIKNQYGEVCRTFSGWSAPPLRLSWDGLDDVGRRVADGRYYYEIIIVDKAGETISFSDYLTSIVTLGPAGEIEFIPQE